MAYSRIHVCHVRWSLVGRHRRSVSAGDNDNMARVQSAVLRTRTLH